MKEREILIIKQGATGDVVRTTVLLHILSGRVTWVTAPYNKPVLPQRHPVLREIVGMDEVDRIRDRRFDLVISLDDDPAGAGLASSAGGEVMGAFLEDGRVRYTGHFREWFDMSLVSEYGKAEADRRKLANRKSFQELLFRGFDRTFDDSFRYLVNEEVHREPGSQRVGIEARAGDRWPTKAWNGYETLAGRLKEEGREVVFFGQRETLLAYLQDIAACSLVVTGDTLAMHIALALGIPTVALFTCTSPWEIHGYGIMEKIVSPHLAEAFYRNEYVKEAVESIAEETVYAACRRMENGTGGTGTDRVSRS